MADFLGVFAGMDMAFQFKCEVGKSEPITQGGFHSELHAIRLHPNAFFDNDMRIQRLFVFLHLPQMQMVHILNARYGVYCL